jgi:thioredoxin 1
MKEINSEKEFDLVGSCVVKFGAKWCGPCKQVTEQLEKLEQEFDNMRFISVDIDSIPNLARDYQIRSLPTTLIFQNSKEVKRIVGKTLIDSLRKTLRDFT